MDFKGSSKRLLKRFGREKASLWLMLGAVAVSVALSVAGPKILGKATDLVFAGVVGREMAAGTTKAQAIEALREEGRGSMADMLSGVDFTPGEGIDFGAVGNVLLVALVIYVGAGLLMLVATRVSIRIINRIVFQLREDLQTKLARLPLSYFDRAKRGEVLSRATKASTTSRRPSSRRWASSSTRC
ncbi:multidrug ABC transporter ATP-binding protein [Streptomyces badius]